MLISFLPQYLPAAAGPATQESPCSPAPWLLTVMQPHTLCRSRVQPQCLYGLCPHPPSPSRSLSIPRQHFQSLILRRVGGTSRVSFAITQAAPRMRSYRGTLFCCKDPVGDACAVSRCLFQALPEAPPLRTNDSLESPPLSYSSRLTARCCESLLVGSTRPAHPHTSEWPHSSRQSCQGLPDSRTNGDHGFSLL